MAEPNSQQISQTTTGTVEASEFDSLLRKEFKPKTDQAKEAVERAVRTLAEQALADTQLISTDVVQSIEAIIAQLDQKLTEQINLILHHEDFQKLEGAWRGLSYLVNNTETDEMLKIRVMNISKLEVGKTLKRYKGTAWDQSPLFKSIYEAEVRAVRWRTIWLPRRRLLFRSESARRRTARGDGEDGGGGPLPIYRRGEPDRHANGVVAGTRQSPRSDEDFQTPEYAAWRSLRESDDSRYIGLAMPRFLARLPYGAKTDPVEAFDFEEDTASADHTRYTWANSAYAMATNITRSFKLYGWCSRIRGVESGGALEGLPVHTFPTDDGGVDMKCPTEIAISDRREAELAKNGFMPLVHRKNSDFAAFIGAQSLQKPTEYRRSRRHRECKPGGASPLHVRVLPLRALLEVHRARQDRLVQGTRRHAPVAEHVDHELRGRRSGQFVGNHESPEAARSCGGRRRRGRGKPRLLLVEVFPPPALSAGGLDRFASLGLEAAVTQRRRLISRRVVSVSQTHVPRRRVPWQQ